MTDLRTTLHSFLDQIISAPDAALPALLETHLTPDTVWDISFPIERLRDVVREGLILPLRVLDFYRCAGDKIIENRVLLDYLHLFQQMGVDLVARSEAMK